MRPKVDRRVLASAVRHCFRSTLGLYHSGVGGLFLSEGPYY